MGTATRIASLALAVVAAAASLAAQGATSTVDRPQFIKMVAKDYVFDAPQNVQSGIATIHLVNQGTDIHHVLVQELPNGRTIKEFFDATRSAGVPPSWSRTLAQSSAIASGGEAFLSFRMPPGRYLL